MQPDSTTELARWALSALIVPTLILVAKMSLTMGRYMQKLEDIDERVKRLEDLGPMRRMRSHSAD